MELWAWLEGDRVERAEGRWSDLVNSLSGLFCASLNFIDSGKTVRPVLSFEPEGALEEMQPAQRSSTGESRGRRELLHGMLPHEVVCTENLTPFLKLLPSKGKAGISSLLDGHKVFDANWQTMSIDVRPICPPNQQCELEIHQTVDMVLDIERSMRTNENRIPRPPPVEELICDESKTYNAEDTCYPKAQEGETAWSLSRIFGRAIRGSCLLAGPDAVDVLLEVPSERTVEVISEVAVQDTRAEDGFSRSYSLPEGKDFDLNLPQQILEQQTPLEQPPLYASRQTTGYGAERGGMQTILRNPSDSPRRIVYLESLPWFLRPYIHTLQVDGGKIEKMYYTPLLDRKRGTHLELLIEVPAESEVELTYDFEKAILRYTEYPPDANRGFDIPPAVIRILPSTHTSPSLDLVSQSSSQGSYLRTTSLLLPLPTPDFSMPYNVIILTSTVIALGFGSIFNLLVRRFMLVEEVPVSPIAMMARKAVERGREVVGKFRAAKGSGRGSEKEMERKEGGEKVADGGSKASNGKPKEPQSKKDR